MWSQASIATGTDTAPAFRREESTKLHGVARTSLDTRGRCGRFKECMTAAMDYDLDRLAQPEVEPTQFDLDRLGPTEFEHMIQSLAIAELGIQVTTFGAGKDGGREATFEGKVAAPRDAGLGLWDGYGIVQAKTIRFAGVPAKNAETLVASIGSELTRFMPSNGNKPERAPKPDYYIVATNARLSPAGDTGGVDSLKQLLRDHPVGLRGHSVWHYEHICRLLDIHDGVRKTYAGFITAGDILSKLRDMLDGGAAQVGDALKAHAALQIAAREDLNLETSEFSGAEKLDLSQIAIDLPGRMQDDTDVMVVRHILSAGDGSLRSEIRGGLPYGFVVIGGPGQGKSTLGQIICQSYRVGLLDAMNIGITPRIDKAIAGTKARLAELKLAIPRNRRWPAFVDLSAFADALAERPAMTAVEYVAQQLRNQGASITPAQVASWLASWPWVLVLDGLDEVPARESRLAVVSALNELIVESRLNNWDVMIVCTTRPQGYDGEFSELDPQQMELRNLLPSEGLDYGRRIVNKKFAEDPEKTARVLARMTEASKQPHSAKLMQTPLQVSIMEYLLEELNAVPSTRHELFDGFYRAIYSRESGKAGHLGKLLKVHSEQVEWVHEQAALYFQVRSEEVGASSVSISESDIVDLFTKRLREQEFDDSEINSLASELNKATKQRLVLLVPRRKDQITFEVKSLQEYMAARAVTVGDPRDVFDRLDILAPSAYWRNTWQLAVGRLYSQRPHERDALLERLRRLDTETPLGRFIGQGARLAIDLLEGDFALAVPAHRKSLLALSMTQVTRWPGPELKRLSTIARAAMNSTDTSARALVGDAVTDAFNSTGRSKVGAVAILRDWHKDSGASGIFARARLNDDDSWRPDNERAVGRTKISIAEVFGGIVRSMDLSDEEANIWANAGRFLGEVSVVDPVTPAEAVTISRAELPNLLPAQLVEIMSDLPTQDFLISVANAVPISSAPASIVMRRIMVAVVESLPVGQHKLLSAPGSGLF